MCTIIFCLLNIPFGMSEIHIILQIYTDHKLKSLKNPIILHLYPGNVLFNYIYYKASRF